MSSPRSEYTGNLRIILCGNSTSRIIRPIRSRCLLLRVGAPKEQEVSLCSNAHQIYLDVFGAAQICNVLQYVARKESLTVPAHVASMLARNSNGNLRRALLSLEALHTQDPNFCSISQSTRESLDTIPRPDWESYCSQVSQKILAEQSPERLLEVRACLYELLVHCIPPTVIIAVRAAAAAHLTSLMPGRAVSDDHQTLGRTCG